MTVMAIYEDGVFKPLTPVDLPEHTRVEVTPVGPKAKASEKSGKSLLELHGLKQLGPAPPDFKEPLEDFKEYME